MKNRSKVEKIGGAALAGLCVFLVFKLVSEIMGNPAPVAKTEATVSGPSTNPAPSAQSAPKKTNSSRNSDSALDVQPLDKYAPKPLPGISRNPFDFGAPPLTPAQKAMLAARAAGGAMTAGSGPARPQIPLRAIGYSEKPGAGPEAYLADSDDVYVVHDGDVVSKRYKVLKITSLIVEVQDGASGEKAQLPIPQVE